MIFDFLCRVVSYFGRFGSCRLFVAFVSSKSSVLIQLHRFNENAVIGSNRFLFQCHPFPTPLSPPHPPTHRFDLTLAKNKKNINLFMEIIIDSNGIIECELFKCVSLK